MNDWSKVDLDSGNVRIYFKIVEKRFVGVEDRPPPPQKGFKVGNFRIMHLDDGRDIVLWIDQRIFQSMEKET